MKTKFNSKRVAGYIDPMPVFMAALVIVLILVGYQSYQTEFTRMPESYRAWVKQTENPKGLSYAEWRALIRTERRDSSSNFIFVPMPR